MKNVVLFSYLVLMAMNLISCGTKQQYYGSVSQGDDETVIHGSANLSNSGQVFKSLKIYGSAKLNDVEVNNSLEVFGSSNFANVKALTLDIKGSSNLTNVQIKDGASVYGSSYVADSVIGGLFRIFGSFYAKHSTFKDLIVSAAKVEIENSTLDSITFKKDNDERVKCLTLSKTIVNRDVVFEDGNGKVILANGAVIKGKLVGAIVEKK